MLAWALAADTPTIIARALNPPSKACFITLPPFGQENATLFIGSITGNKIKEASARRKRISGHLGGKIRINAGVPASAVLPAGSACIETRGPPCNGPRAQARTHDRPAPCCRGSWPRVQASLNSRRAFARRPAAGPPAWGPASAGPQSPPARTSRKLAGCNSRSLVGLACPRIEGHGGRGEYDSHLGLWGYGPWPSVSEPSC